jgi:hypothetical protein
MAGLITSKSIFLTLKTKFVVELNHRLGKNMQGFFFKRSCHDVPTIPSRGQLGSSMPLEGLLARGDCTYINPTIGF